MHLFLNVKQRAGWDEERRGCARSGWRIPGSGSFMAMVRFGENGGPRCLIRLKPAGGGRYPADMESRVAVLEEIARTTTASLERIERRFDSSAADTWPISVGCWASCWAASAMLGGLRRVASASWRTAFTGCSIIQLKPAGRVMDWDAPAIVLDARPYGEGDAIATVMTAEHGAHRGLARGGAARGRTAIWQPGNLVQVRWVARLAEQLGSFSAELVHPAAALAMDDALHLAMLSAVCAVAEGALPEREPHARVFEGWCI